MSPLDAGLFLYIPLEIAQSILDAGSGRTCQFMYSVYTGNELCSGSLDFLLGNSEKRK